MSDLSFNSRTQRVNVEAVPMLDSLLQSKPVKAQPAKTELTLRELISSVYNSIVQMKEKGYSSAEVCEIILEQTKMVIAPATLDAYVRQESKKRKNKRSKQQQQKLPIEHSSERSDRVEEVSSNQVEAQILPETAEPTSQPDLLDVVENKRQETASNESRALTTRSKPPTPSGNFNLLIMDRSKL